MKMGLEIRLFFIRHKNLIILIFLFFIGLISLVQYLNGLAEEKYGVQEPHSYIQEEVVNDNEENTIIEEIKTPLYEENIEYTRLIKKFIEYCEEDEKEKAYEMLSTSCKDEFYQTLDIFYLNYCKTMFNNKYSVEVIYTGDIKNTYNIVFKEDMLHTAKLEDLEEITHYYKIEKDIFNPGNKIYIREVK